MGSAVGYALGSAVEAAVGSAVGSAAVSRFRAGAESSREAPAWTAWIGAELVSSRAAPTRVVFVARVDHPLMCAGSGLVAIVFVARAGVIHAKVIAS